MDKKSVFGVVIAIAVIAVFFLVGSSLYPFGGEENSAATGLSAGITGDSAPTGVETTDIVTGTGEDIKSDSVVSFNYVGKLEDGTVFDASETHGGPLTVDLSVGGLIPGFTEGLKGMKVGGKREISIPPELAYGGQAVQDEQGNVVIPANSTLVFEVEIVEIVSPEEISTGEN